MTQTLRRFAVLALFLAVSVPALRAADDQKVAPPPCKSEMLPAPHCVGTVANRYAASCCQGCTTCASCACCSQCRARTTPADETQYVVTTKMVHASPDGDCEETMAPKVTVFAGQTANVSAQDVETVTGIHGGLDLMIRVTKQDKQVRINLGVEESKACAYSPAGQLGRMTMNMQTASNVTLGKMKRLVFTKNANGTDASWVEVTVMAIPPEADAEDSPLDCLGEVVDVLMDGASDVAMSLFGDDNEVKQAEFTTPAAVAPLPYPVLIAAPCPTCQQCVAVEAVKKSVKQIRIDASHGRKSFEIRDGDKGWKGTADRITLRDGYLVMEGVHTVSSDGEDEITAAKLSVKAADLEIQIGD